MQDDNLNDLYTRLFRKGNKVMVTLTNRQVVIGIVMGIDRKYSRVAINNDGQIVAIPYRYISSVKLIEGTMGSEEG